jgi:hypothetical protein
MSESIHMKITPQMAEACAFALCSDLEAAEALMPSDPKENRLQHWESHAFLRRLIACGAKREAFGCWGPYWDAVTKLHTSNVMEMLVDVGYARRPKGGAK